MPSWESYKSFHYLWCWVWLVSLWEMVSHPSRCELTLVRIDVVVWARLEWWRRFGFRQVMWHFMLESAKDQILGVDPLGQHVPPCVRYGMACLLIRYATGSVSCSVEWGWLPSVWPVFVTFFVNRLKHMVKRGHFVREASALQAGPLCVGIRSKAWHTPIVGLYNCM
jgi:hypothetical protein